MRSVVLFVALAGCLDNPELDPPSAPVVPVAQASSLAVAVHGDGTNLEVVVDAMSGACIQLPASTTVTVNDQPLGVGSLGGYLDRQDCMSAFFTGKVSDAMVVRISDGLSTAQITVANGAITRCDAGRCTLQ